MYSDMLDTIGFVKEQDPELAEFLRKLDALRVILQGRTTVVFDTNVPPFDLLKPQPITKQPVKQ